MLLCSCSSDFALQSGELGASPGLITDVVRSERPKGSARRYRERPQQQRERSSVVIVSSLFLVLLAAALLIGGRAAIDPLLQSAATARQEKGIGEVRFTMPDGIYCRHMSFDNATAAVREGSLEKCGRDLAEENESDGGRFMWRTH